MNFDTVDTLVFYIFYMITLIVSYRFPWKRFNWYAVISFTILLGIKGNGIDYGIYNYAFSLLVNNPNSLFSSNYLDMLQDNMVGVDFGYLHLAVIKLISFISSSSVWYFSFLALLQILGLDLFIQQFRKKSIKCLLVFFFFTTLMFSETFIAMRQMSAFLLYLPLIKFIINKDLKKYVIGCVLLATIHKSILIMLPVYFLVDKNYLKNIKLQIILYLFVIILASFLEKRIGGLLMALFSNAEDFNYAGYFNDAETFKFTVNRSALVYFFRFSTFVFLVSNYKNFVKRYNTLGIVFYNLVYLGYLIQELSFNLSIYRVNYYFYYNSFVVLTLMVYDKFAYSNNNLQKVFGSYIIVLYSLWFSNCVLKGAASCAPYELCRDVIIYF